MAEKTKSTELEESPDAEKEFAFAEDPVFDVQYKGDCAYEVKVSIPQSNRSKKAEELFEELKAEAELPGFRRGRAPRKLIEKKFSKAVQLEVEAKLVSAALQKLIKDQELKPIGTPDIDGFDEDHEPKPDQPLDFTLRFEVAPRVELGQYRGIAVERPVVTIDDKDIDEAVDEMRERFATYETAEGSTKAKDGDQIIISFKGTVDGEPFDGGAAENYPYVLGTSRFLPEFEQALKGATAGKEVSCTVNFPGDYVIEKLRGKSADFKIQVHEIKRKTLPKADDEFAESAGYENLNSLREKIAAQLREGSAAQSQRMAEARALRTIVESSKFEIPTSMVERITETEFRDRVYRLLNQGQKLDEINAKSDEIRAEARESVIRSIQSLVALNEIAEAEGIVVTEEDLEHEMEFMAARIGIEAERLARYLRSSEDQSTYEDRIMRAKTLKLILDHAKITDKELTREEMDQQDAGQAGHND